MDSRSRGYVVNIAILLSIAFAGTDASGVELTISPRHATVQPGNSLTVICRTKPLQPLTSCLFYVTGIPVIDLSLGRSSKATEDYRYSGRGLDVGECGIEFLRLAHDFPDQSKMFTVTCAARIENHGWRVAYMGLLVSGTWEFPVTVQQEKTMVQPGTNVTILCQSGAPLTKCLFQARHLEHIDLSRGHLDAQKHSSMGAVDSYEYFGGGLQQGDCGIRLIGVKEKMNGLVWCAAKSDTGKWGYDFSAVIVDQSPSAPVLKLSSRDVKLGATLNATCTVKNGRPRPTISWSAPFDKGIRDLYSDSISDASLNFEAVTVIQEMTKNVTVTDHMEEVVCTAKFNDGKHEITSKRAINVRFCGMRNFDGAKPLVFGGKVAKPNEFPWHAGIYRKVGGGHLYICGGSVISARYVISAAHCFWNSQYSRAESADSYGVVVGKTLVNWASDLHAQRFGIEALVLHEKYNDRIRHYEDDIAMISLSAAIVFSQSVHPICLTGVNTNDELSVAVGNLGVVPGFGLTESASAAEQLRFVDLPVVGKDKCLEIIPRDFLRYVTPGKLCAGYFNRSVTVCGGDSGGGLVFFQNSSQNYFLHGIVSLAPKSETVKNCNPHTVALFTEVSDYTAWIQPFFGIFPFSVNTSL